MWKHSQVASDLTHHQVGGQALYESRFDEIQSFRDPGLAPVRLGRFWFHIRQDGLPAYASRFSQAFGFYEGLAAVDLDGEWFHIDPLGIPAYSARFRWCGNFQEGRAVVSLPEGGYGHVLPDGTMAYRRSHVYVGDYREGAAVVLDHDGMMFHIDNQGHPLSGVRFLDLAPYHKGIAPAKDRRGWFHIDRKGRELYPHRFQAVEPFYNGLARAVTPDGAILRVDEHGKTVETLVNPTFSSRVPKRQ